MSKPFLNLSVCIMHPNNKWEYLFEHIPTWEEADLIAQYAMCMRTSYNDVIFIWPGYNRSIIENHELWVKANKLAQQYAAEKKRSNK